MRNVTVYVTVTASNAAIYRLTTRHRRPRPIVCTPANFTLQQPWPAGVSQTGTGKLVVKKSQLTANRVVFVFDLASTGCTPSGVHLRQRNGSSDRNGGTNFPPGLRRPVGTSAYKITDIVHNYGVPGKWVWAIGIPAQDAAGHSVLFDPDIENQN